jgi:hypothetical protein
MIVRDKTFPMTLAGGLKIDAEDQCCPCRKCWSITRLFDECITRMRNGCPDPKPDPDHMLSVTKIGRAPRNGKARCARCGERV